MHPAFGLLGAFVFAIGGAISFYGLAYALTRSSFYSLSFGNFVGFFAGSLLMGLGLWIIALSGRAEKK